MSRLGPLSLLASRVSAPWVVILGRSMTADTWVLLADTVVLAAMATPVGRLKESLKLPVSHMTFNSFSLLHFDYFLIPCAIYMYIYTTVDTHSVWIRVTSSQTPVDSQMLPQVSRALRSAQGCGWSSLASAAKWRGWGSVVYLPATPAVYTQKHTYTIYEGRTQRPKWWGNEYSTVCVCV